MIYTSGTVSKCNDFTWSRFVEVFEILKYEGRSIKVIEVVQYL